MARIATDAMRAHGTTSRDRPDVCALRTVGPQAGGAAPYPFGLDRRSRGSVSPLLAGSDCIVAVTSHADRPPDARR